LGELERQGRDRGLVGIEVSLVAGQEEAALARLGILDRRQHPLEILHDLEGASHSHGSRRPGLLSLEGDDPDHDHGEDRRAEPHQGLGGERRGDAAAWAT
jgi:hypothetical protein